MHVDSGELLDSGQIEAHSYGNHVAASKGKRFTNYLIDVVCYFIFSFIVGILIAFVAISLSKEQQYDNWANSEDGIMDYLLGAILLFAYFFCCEVVLNGRTIGKLLTGTRAVDQRGNVPDATTIAIRSASRIVPFEPLSFLGGGTGWHDSWSNTRVIDDEKTY